MTSCQSAEFNSLQYRSLLFGLRPPNLTAGNAVSKAAIFQTDSSLTACRSWPANNHIWKKMCQKGTHHQNSDNLLNCWLRILSLHDVAEDTRSCNCCSCTRTCNHFFRASVLQYSPAEKCFLKIYTSCRLAKLCFLVGLSPLAWQFAGQLAVRVHAVKYKVPWTTKGLGVYHLNETRSWSLKRALSCGHFGEPKSTAWIVESLDIVNIRLSDYRSHMFPAIDWVANFEETAQILSANCVEANGWSSLHHFHRSLSKFSNRQQSCFTSRSLSVSNETHAHEAFG